MSTVIKDLGAVSAYAYAVEKGYTGTEAEYAELMADYAEVGQRAEDAAESALNSKTAAQTAATTATNKASEATTAAQTATTKAGEASQSASEATTAKNDAVTAKTAAETAQGKAEDAQAAAESVAESIPSDYSQLSEDVGELKSGLAQLPKVLTPEETEADLYISDANGNVLAKFEDGHIKTKNFDSSEVGTDMVKEADKTDADLYICDSFGNAVAEFKNGHIKTKNFDSENASAEILQEVQDELESLAEDVSGLQNATSGILYRNKDATDGVYAACRWHQPSSSAKQFCILMGGDIHGDRVRTNSMIEYLNAVDAFDAGIMLGDIGGSTFADDITFYTNAIAKAEKPFLTVIGNHDSGGHTSEAELCSKYITPNIGCADLAAGEYVSGNTYYYKDFADYGIRLIVLNQYNYPDGEITYAVGDGCYGQDEIDWFIQTLNSTPTTYGVIIAVHTWAGAMAAEVDNILTASTCSNAYTPHIIVSDRSVILKIVDAWIKGGSFSETLTYTVDFGWTELNVNADFTERGTGEFITYIGGHWHMSILSHGYNYPEQKAYHVDCTGLESSLQGDTPRRAGTRSEDAICALAVDRSAKTVKVFRIGAHFTKDAVDRLYGKYSYAIQ